MGFGLSYIDLSQKFGRKFFLVLVIYREDCETKMPKSYIIIRSKINKKSVYI